jgi:hypothetical protein
MKPIILIWICFLILAVCITALPADVQGCGGAYREGERVDVANETALIIWDEAARTEHFVRRASFVGSAYDFGFLVPTPNRPNLETADPELFNNLATITKPKTVHQDFYYPSLACGGFAAGAKSEASGVIVWEQKQVGGLDVVVLGFQKEKNQDLKEAASELLTWLAEHNYAVRPELQEWLIPYIRDNWVITAFKIAGQTPVEQMATVQKVTTEKSESPKKESRNGLQSSAVLLSFKTDRPFFPYREPKDQRDEKAGQIFRLLRVFIAAKERMAGKLGDGKTEWPGKTVWANSLRDDERRDVLRLSKAPNETALGTWWLTEFEDRSSPRPGTDEVYFEPSTQKTVIERNPEIIPVYRFSWGAAACIASPFLLLAAMTYLSLRLLWFLWRRRSRASQPPG